MRKEALFLLGTQAQSLYTLSLFPLYHPIPLQLFTAPALKRTCLNRGKATMVTGISPARKELDTTVSRTSEAGKIRNRKLSDDIPCTDYSLGNSFSVHLHLWFYYHLLCFSGHEGKLWRETSSNPSSTIYICLVLDLFFINKFCALIA